MERDILHPLVSVVVVSYNHGRFIADCLDSVFNQSYVNIEVFVIDNGSKDGSKEQIKQSKYFDRFTYIDNKQMSLVDSLNQVSKKIKGKYFSAVAADDLWYENKLSEQVKVLESNAEFASVSSNVHHIDNNGILTRSKKINSRQYTFDDLFLSQKWYFPAVTAMTRVDILNEVGWYDSNFKIEDYYMWLKITSREYLLFLDEQILGAYRRHENNISKNVEFMIDESYKIIELYRDKEDYFIARNNQNLYFFNLCAVYNKKLALKFLKEITCTKENFNLYISGIIKLLLPLVILRKIILNK